MKAILKSKEMSIAAILILLCIILSYLSPAFFTFSNLTDVLKANAVLGILAIGMTLVIITGGIDVSVAAVTSAVAVITGHLMIYLPDSFLSLLVIFLVAPLCGIVFGLINGYLVAKVEIPAIVVTLGMMSIISGAILYLTNGVYVNSRNFPSIFIDFANAKILGISILVYIFFAVAALTWYVMKNTVIGRSVFAIGGNSKSAIRVGIDFKKVQMFVFAYMGFLAGIAAIVQTAYIKAIDPNGLIGFELIVIAAVVIGGANILGGRGTVFGTILGVILLGVMQNGLILAHIDTYWQKVVVGSIILLAVSYDHIQYKRAQSQLSNIKVEA